MKSLVPVKTEYRGVVFDSKSEAIIARTFDIAGIEWEYHPKEIITSHEWDFWVRATGTYFGFCGLIEYKPRMPTMTYIKNLTEKTRECPVNSLVLWGSKWTPALSGKKISSSVSYLVTYPVFCTDGKFGWGDFCPVSDCGFNEPFSNRHKIEDFLGIEDWQYDIAFSHRFDLKQELPF